MRATPRAIVVDADASAAPPLNTAGSRRADLRRAGTRLRVTMPCALVAML